MRDTWYGDKRDLVKWGTLTHLAERERIKTIIQVAYLRPGNRPALHTDSGAVPIRPAVWNFFRNVPAVNALGAGLGCTIEVIANEFKPRDRAGYCRVATERLKGLAGGKLVLLDPDTGLAPGKPSGKHVTTEGDWLVLYQHASRDKQWREAAKERFAAACGASEVETFSAPKIASDVAFFAAKKT